MREGRSKRVSGLIWKQEKRKRMNMDIGRENEEIEGYGGKRN